MVKLGRLTDYGAVIMAMMAEEAENSLMNATTLADKTHIALPTVSKLLKTLANHNLLVSTRGAHGGYRLSRPADQITVLEIITALEGPVMLTECIEHEGNCSLEAHCQVRRPWHLINQIINKTLQEITLADIAKRSLKRDIESLASGVKHA